jgi:hypothetical protein
MSDIYRYQDQSATDLTVTRTGDELTIKVNDGWHDIEITLPPEERCKLAARVS